MKVLHLTLKKKWFDMIASGEKKEEYREIKPSWENKLQRINGMLFPEGLFREYDIVHFYNGCAYSQKFPNFKVEFKGVEIGAGKEEWGAPEKEPVYIIKLGKILNKSWKD